MQLYATTSLASNAVCTGEYNLRLGIMKELQPDMVATYQGLSALVLSLFLPCVVEKHNILSMSVNMTLQPLLTSISFDIMQAICIMQCTAGPWLIATSTCISRQARMQSCFWYGTSSGRQGKCSKCGAGDARVLEGHSFIVGAAVSIGGRDIKPGINVYRFANRIPLLFEVTHCQRLILPSDLL